MRRVLTADLGNSALKLVLWDASESVPRVIARERLPVDGELLASLATYLDAAEPPDGVALASVARVNVTDAVRAALEEALGQRGGVIEDAGLDNRCEQPSSTGADRLFAARGVFELGLDRAVIVDAGTALTVDAFRVEEERATFLGGAIAPGLALLAASLAGGTARLPLIAPVVGAAALGRSTRGALEAGVVVGFRGAARELVRRVGEEAQLDGATVVVTGGDASFLADTELFAGREVRVEPDLVHRGLLGAWLARIEA